MAFDISNILPARRRDSILEIRAIRGYRPLPGWLRFISVVLPIAFIGAMLPDNVFVPSARATCAVLSVMAHAERVRAAGAAS